MRILQANKFFFPEYGTEKYLFDLMASLEAHGHEVVHFSMQHPKNRPSPYARHFVSNIDYAQTRGPWQALKAWGRMVYSIEAQEKFADLLDETQPNIVHIHSIHHQISPSILLEAKRRGIPIVQTLHDHKLVCPAYHFPMRNGHVCLQCQRGHWLHLLLHRAHKNSLLATAGVVAESWLHSVTRIYERTVDRFIVPSHDMARRLIELGISRYQLQVVPHHIDTDLWSPSDTVGRGILLAGRLAPERGLDHLIAAAAALPRETFYVAGDGPEREALRAKLAVRDIQNVKLLGRLADEQLRHLFKSCRILFYPTQTFETFGLTVLEAMASGKPVVATRLGAVQDLVRDGETGLLYDPAHPEQGIAALQQLLASDVLAQSMGRAGRTRALEYSPERNYQDVLAVYQDVLAAKQHVAAVRAFATNAAPAEAGVRA